MRLNGLPLDSHSGLDGRAAFLVAATIAEASALDGKDLVVTDEDGTEVARYAGYTVTSVVAEGGRVRVTCARRLDDASKAAIEGLEATAKSLSERVYRVSSDEVAPLRSALDALSGTDMPAVRSALSTLAASQAGSLSQSELHGLGSLWPDFAPGAFYRTRQLVRFEGHYYFVLTDTWATTGEGNRPDKDTKSYKLMGDPDESGVFPFMAPLGDSDAYGRGDRVSVNGTVYVSQVDGNKSVPGQGEDGQKHWLKA